MIYLSASSIKDFISCSRRFAYRVYQSDLAIATQEIAIGDIVHHAIENHWNDREAGFNFSYAESSKRDIDSIGKQQLDRCLTNYYDYHTQYLTLNDEIEYNFKYKLYDDVYLVGKMDRIIKSTNTVIDWKTGDSFVSTINNDIQFLVYYAVYKRLFGITPTVLYINLNKNKTLAYRHNPKFEDELFNRVIPKILDVIHLKDFVKEGYFNNACKSCSFIQDCWKEE